MRPWNFSAGPSALPLEVLQQAAAEMTDWHGCGMSVMEMSHRGKQFTRIRDEAVADLRELLAVPDEFEILFMQGGATAENAIVPMNLIGRGGAHKADYILSGIWSGKSYKEAQRYGDIAVAATSGAAAEIDGVRQEPWTWFPAVAEWRLRPDAAYLHLCSNETIGGVEFSDWPDMAALGAPGVPLVVDASSHFLSRPIDFSKAALVYAGAQKNAGPAGVTVVLIRKELIGHALAVCPSAFDYVNVAESGSMFNTPPTYAIYIAGLVFKWLKQQGGVAAIEAANIAKARLLYDYLDGSGFYINRVHAGSRSRMNVPFFLCDESLNAEFLAQADKAGLMQLKGHKSVGGMRASIYNAVPLQAVQALVSFMQEFERRHG
ncbi:3-phosphoserine/phosphohydroxythreonine transaminase [Parapusillimonas granuli]|uniref:Phosphoserine aminotransferase n=1 Tax=Parapusillimonas granuli TaxID=380911 RepID=A0A853G6A1_9BURK|nr:3-phosphoserine/phosphohydroxythreonine transaminase [Parapusillimonas granuli]MBB5217111.1 phosphoserine aminotransferase [Parapusillimonas granuli]NYT50126.1 3-phosphoserine/phosphohydroxythreonine transaminase [Parapusillimonas granuli]